MDNSSAVSQSKSDSSGKGASKELVDGRAYLAPDGAKSVCYEAVCGCSIITDQSDSERVAESLEKILRAQNRLEQIRLNLDQVDRIGLASRTVSALIESVTRHLENALDLLTVKILLVEGQEIAAVFKRCSPYGGGTISFDACAFGEDSPLFISGDDLDRLRVFFRDESDNLGSAVVAPIVQGTEVLGVVCLGSGDPLRYSRAKSSALMMGLADKIALALTNAFEHENAARGLWVSEVEGVYSELFFREYLHKEFNRAWRWHKPFTVMAVSWGDGSAASAETNELLDLFRRNLRSADIAARGESVGLWALLPETDAATAEKITDRIFKLAEEAFPGTTLHIGMTEFSRTATAMPILLNRASQALDEAMQLKVPVVVKMP